MLKQQITISEALKSLRDNTQGVVSFEYVIVAACVVAAVIAAFGATGGDIGGALSGAITKIVGKINGLT